MGHRGQSGTKLRRKARSPECNPLRCRETSPRGASPQRAGLRDDGEGDLAIRHQGPNPRRSDLRVEHPDGGLGDDVVIAGSGRAKLDDEIIELRVSDVLRVPPAVIRSFEAGPDGLDVICIGGRKPKDGDTEKFDDPGAVRRHLYLGG
jgi:hypothetical protein